MPIDFPEGVFRAGYWDFRFASEQLGIPYDDVPRLVDLGLPYGGHIEGNQLVFYHVDLRALMRFFQLHIGDLYTDDHHDSGIEEARLSDRQNGGHWNEDHDWVDASGFIDGSKSSRRIGLFKL